MRLIISSWFCVFDPDGCLVSLDHFTGILADDGATVTVGAATQLATIFNYLLDSKRALTCSPGVITYQTIAGAISSCTHGQGLYQSSLSDIVVGLRVVLASGEVVTIDEQDARLPAFRASLGCLGVILSVRLVCYHSSPLSPPPLSFGVLLLFSKSEEGFSCPWVLTAREIGPNEVVSLFVWRRPLLSR
jgi:FAD/FMN-containing dehydrogenase